MVTTSSSAAASPARQAAQHAPAIATSPLSPPPSTCRVLQEIKGVHRPAVFLIALLLVIRVAGGYGVPPALGSLLVLQPPQPVQVPSRHPLNGIEHKELDHIPYQTPISVAPCPSPGPGCAPGQFGRGVWVVLGSGSNAKRSGVRAPPRRSTRRARRASRVGRLQTPNPLHNRSKI